MCSSDLRGFGGHLVLVTGVDLRLAQTVAHLAQVQGLKCIGNFTKPIGSVDAAEILAQSRKIRSKIAAAPIEVPPGVEEGLKNGTGLEVWWQPQISVGTRRPVGAECLARWRAADGRILAPASFLPAVHDSGCMQLLTQGVVEQTLKALSGPLSPWKELKASINLAGEDLQDFGLADVLIDRSRVHRIAPGRLTWELTETAVLHHPKAALEVITRLRLKIGRAHV